MKLVARGIVRSDDAVPADSDRPEPFDPLSAHLEQAPSLRAQPLNRVDKKGDTPGPAEFSEGAQVVTKSGGKLDVTDGQYSGRLIDRGNQVVEPDPSVAAGHQSQRHTSARQVHPRIKIRGI